MTRVGRNDPCPCGSGKKYKQCCGSLEKDPAGLVRAAPALPPNSFQVALAHHEAGRLSQAEALYRQILQIEPEHPEALHFLGVIAYQTGNHGFAVELIGKAIELSATSQMYSNLGAVFQAQHRLDNAAESYRKAIMLKPDFADAYHNLGIALLDQGKLVEAAENFRKALTLKPDYAEAYSKLLFALNLNSDTGGQEAYRVSKEYEAMIGAPLRAAWRTHHNDKNPDRRLRVGYVSPDFRRHAVAYFAEPIFANHDKAQVKIFCYSEAKREDAYTGRFRQFSDHWHSTVGLSDDAVAEMIRSHQIDILVDLAGHTANNRLLVFARKPAPVQLTYLGYPGTTGLSAMDYRITDRYADPEGTADACYAERLIRLPDSLCCYHPAATMPEISVLPALERGHITFGSFNSFNKIDQSTIALWAELLRAIPSAHLLMLTVPVGEARQHLIRRFAESGISAQRLAFYGKLSPAEFYCKFHEVDIALDTVMVSGGTTTCESLWMGVPVVALPGQRFITRVSYSFLNTAGCAEFAAASPEEYIRIATHLAGNVAQLADIRAGLRARVAASPLVDEAGFTRKLENAYREIWSNWCGAGQA